MYIYIIACSMFIYLINKCECININITYRYTFKKIRFTCTYNKICQVVSFQSNIVSFYQNVIQLFYLQKADISHKLIIYLIGITTLNTSVYKRTRTRLS